MYSVSTGEALMISGVSRGAFIKIRGWLMLGPVGFGHQVFVATEGDLFQFLHDIFLPVTCERPRINRDDRYACFGVLSFFCFDPLVIILVTD